MALSGYGVTEAPSSAPVLVHLPCVQDHVRSLIGSGPFAGHGDKVKLMKSLLPKAFLLVIILPQAALAQIQSQADLLKALTTNSRSGPGYKVELLKSSGRYVTADLWTKLIEQASRDYYYGNPDRAFEIYSVASAVATTWEQTGLAPHTITRQGASGIGPLQQGIDHLQSLDASRTRAEERRDLHLGA